MIFLCGVFISDGTWAPRASSSFGILGHAEGDLGTPLGETTVLDGPLICGSDLLHFFFVSSGWIVLETSDSGVRLF